VDKSSKFLEKSSYIDHALQRYVGVEVQLQVLLNSKVTRPQKEPPGFLSPSTLPPASALPPIPLQPSTLSVVKTVSSDDHVIMVSSNKRV